MSLPPFITTVNTELTSAHEAYQTLFFSVPRFQDGGHEAFVRFLGTLPTTVSPKLAVLAEIMPAASQPPITEDDLLLWALVLNNPNETREPLYLWNRAAPLMEPDERMGFFMAQYPIRQAIWWKPDEPIPEYDPSAVDQLRDQMFMQLLEHLERRDAELTELVVGYMVKHMIKNPDVVYAVHPHAATFLVKRMQGLERPTRKMILERVYDPAEREREDDYTTRQLLRKMDMLCETSNERVSSVGIKLGQIMADFKRACKELDADKQAMLDGMNTLIEDTIQGLTPAEARQAWFKAQCAMKRIQLVNKSIAKLIGRIGGGLRTIEDLKTILDQSDACIVYDACLAHMEDILKAAPVHLADQVKDMCNGLIAADWRATHEEEAADLEAKLKTRIGLVFAPESFPKLLDVITAAKARGMEINMDSAIEAAGYKARGKNCWDE